MKMMSLQIEVLMRRLVKDPKYAVETWKILEHYIHIVICNQKPNNDLTFEHLQRITLIMIMHKYGEKLYFRLVSTVISHSKKLPVSFEASLEEFKKKQKEFSKALQLIWGILVMYKDNKYIPIIHELESKSCSKDKINIQMKLKDTLEEIMQRMRCGEVLNMVLMKHIVKMLMVQGQSVYQTYFEKPFFDVSTNYFRRESQRLIECCDYGDYLKKVENCLNEETESVSHYLDEESRVKIIEVVEKEMIENQMTRLVNSGLVIMILDDKYDDLARMYNLLCRVPNGLTLIRDAMTRHFQETSEQLATNSKRLKDPVGFFKSLLEEKDKYNKIINLSFDKTFKNHLNLSFESFIDINLQSPLFISLFVDDKYEDLSRMYNLFCRVPNGLTLIRDVMTREIRETCKLLVNDTDKLKDPVGFVQCLLDEKDKYDNIINLAFNNDKTFENALNSSLNYIINLNPRSPEFISLFLDDKFREGLESKIVLNKVMNILCYLQEKDVFLKYYEQHLAKRLLSGNGESVEAERSFISKLKRKCDYQFTSNLEGMITDIKTSRDTMQRFYEAMGPVLANGPGLYVHVLTTGTWPTTQLSTTCNLPSEILSVCDNFMAYYLGKHNGRKQTWQTNMGSAVIKAKFSGGGQEHELEVSTYQMCVLMLFNNADRLSYKEIEEAVGIPTMELKRCLQSLSCAKGNDVLRKEPTSKHISEGDYFFFNEKFSSKFYKLKIGSGTVEKPHMESEVENQETKQKVEEAGKPHIDCAIIRIMKARRKLDHNNLVAEVTKQLQSRFMLNPLAIKKRIEWLIEHEYMERDTKDRNLYRYLT